VSEEKRPGQIPALVEPVQELGLRLRTHEFTGPGATRGDLSQIFLGQRYAIHEHEPLIAWRIRDCPGEKGGTQSG
jgi:hypothetical protein